MATTKKKREADAAGPPSENLSDEGSSRATPSEPPPAAACVNCGRQATWRTTGTGFVPVDYCDDCGLRAYPDPGGRLERL